ncbi:MAG: transposase [Gammaproteobacteria bacterium]|jgi:putative transposase|nr:transposase [Gammaproteobacteria bacterium]
MSRPLRIEFAGALYHVTSRGDGQDDIYLDDDDRNNFLEVLSDVCDRFNWVVHAYCLMTNHYHLLIETPGSNLSKGMRQLNGVYTQRFNRKHNRVGHAFQGRYKAIIVQKESYLLELARYIVLNPVRAQMVRSAKDCPWSSYRATAGFTNAEKWLTVNWILSSFARKKTDAVILYRAFVSEGRNQPKPWDELKNQIYLGDEEFIDEMQCKISPETNLSEIPSSQRRQVAKPLDYYKKKYSDRDVAILKAYESGGYSMKIIGDYFELHYSWISRILKAKSKT